MKLFYSWQSDTPAKVGRTFIREALDAAIADLDLEDAERPEIDQDTKGVLGSPVIADTIFEKIRNAKVVVADVTLTGGTPGAKRLCNTNVAIELGFALGLHGDGVLLKIMNTHYGPPSELPFDLAHRRWPVQYALSPDAEKGEREKVRSALTKELAAILAAYLAAYKPTPETPKPAQSTYNPGTYWQKGEKLGTTTLSQTEGADLEYPAEHPLVYLRIWPQEKIAPLTIQTLNDYQKSSIEPLCGTSDGWSNVRNRFGTMAYAYSRSGRVLLSSTQVMKSGEIWGVNHFLLLERPEREKYPKFVPTGAYETGLRNSLNRYLYAARAHFGYPSKIMVESGLVNIGDYRLAMPNHYYDRFWGPIFEDVRVVAEVDTDHPATVTQALLKLFEAVFEAAGAERPANYDNFPPKDG